MKLGEMLVRDGRLAVADLDLTIARQGQEGGRLGSLLVAAGLIDVETLTVYLGLELGIPIASGATFERCKASAVRLLSPDQAARFHCVPIVIQGQTLIVAVDDPHDMQVLDEIGQATGYRVIPRMAPEIRIHYYLERFYGVPQPARFAQMPNLGQVSGEVDDSLPAPPLPGLPPRVAEPTAAPNPAPALRVRPQAEPPLPEANPSAIPEHVDFLDTEGHEALELDVADLVEELEADDEELAGQATGAVPSTTKGVTRKKSEGKPEPISSEEALERIANTNKRGDIADAILAHAAEIFSVSTLLLVRDNMAFGWKGFGPGLDADRIETLLMPLDSPSMFHVAVGDERMYRARAFSSGLHSHWFRVLRSSTPAISIVISCAIGSRIVNLLYGQTESGEDLSQEAMNGLSGVMRAASEAYVRLISKSKRAKRAATQSDAEGEVSTTKDPESSDFSDEG